MCYENQPPIYYEKNATYGFNRKIRFMYMCMNTLYQVTAYAMENFNTFSKWMGLRCKKKIIWLLFDMPFTTNRDVCKF